LHAVGGASRPARRTPARRDASADCTRITKAIAAKKVT